MANFRNRYDPLRLFFKRLGTLALFVLVIVVGIGVWRVYTKERESRLLRNEAQIQKSDLEEQSTQLRSETSKLKTDRGKEEALRDQYDLGGRGEGLIVIVDPAQTTPLQATSTFMQKVTKFLIFW